MYKKIIFGFKRHKKKNRIEKGSLYNRKIYIPFSKQPERYLRVWLPENFSKKKSYGVLYMVDGQNAVDHYLTAFGEWNLERHISNLMSQGYSDLIIVGIDCPKDEKERIEEYSPYNPDRDEWKQYDSCYGDELADYLANQIQPYIEDKFNINKDVSIICGSSMGGLISTYICLKYPQKFPFCMAFSPAYNAYLDETLSKTIELWKASNLTKPKIYLYAGGGDSLEIKLSCQIYYFYDLLKGIGFNESNLHFDFKPRYEHNEHSWSEVSYDAIKFLLSGNI